MNDLQATARARAAQIPVSTRGAIERFGLLIIAAGILMATLVAWVLTKVPWSWAHETEVVSTGISYRGGTSAIDIARQLPNWRVYSYERHIAAQGSLYVGVGLVVVGIVIVLVGKAVRS